MFASEERCTSPYSKTAARTKPKGIFLHDKRFWKAMKYCMQIVLPLVELLRLVDGDAKLACGYIYEAMDRVKEKIAKMWNICKGDTKKVWDIIDKKWDLQLHRPIHAAAYSLIPSSNMMKILRRIMKSKLAYS